MKSTRADVADQKHLPFKKRKIEAEEQAAPIEQAAQMPAQFFFAVPAPKPPKNNMTVLMDAIHTHLAMIHPTGLKPFHYSEFLREIACYHRANRHSRTQEQLDIIPTTLFLYEKALVLCPESISAKQQLNTFKQHYVTKEPQITEASVRVARYTSEHAEAGYVSFFNTSLLKYANRIKAIYPDHHNTVFAAVAQHLNSSITVQHMRQKHMTTTQQQHSIAAFNDVKIAPMVSQRNHI